MQTDNLDRPMPVEPQYELDLNARTQKTMEVERQTYKKAWLHEKDPKKAIVLNQNYNAMQSSIQIAKQKDEDTIARLNTPRLLKEAIERLQKSLEEGERELDDKKGEDFFEQSKKCTQIEGMLRVCQGRLKRLLKERGEDTAQTTIRSSPCNDARQITGDLRSRVLNALRKMGFDEKERGRLFGKIRQVACNGYLSKDGLGEFIPLETSIREALRLIKRGAFREGATESGCFNGVQGEQVAQT